MRHADSALWVLIVLAVAASGCGGGVPVANLKMANGLEEYRDDHEDEGTQIQARDERAIAAEVVIPSHLVADGVFGDATKDYRESYVFVEPDEAGNPPPPQAEPTQRKTNFIMSVDDCAATALEIISERLKMRFENAQVTLSKEQNSPNAIQIAVELEVRWTQFGKNIGMAKLTAIRGGRPIAVAEAKSDERSPMKHLVWSIPVGLTIIGLPIVVASGQSIKKGYYEYGLSESIVRAADDLASKLAALPKSLTSDPLPEPAQPAAASNTQGLPQQTRTGSCEGITCSNHGKCVLKHGDPVCACDEGYVPDPTTGLSCTRHQ